MCIRPTVTVLRSVRLERFLGISLKTHGGYDPIVSMVMYPDHLQNWLDSGHGLLISLFWCHFGLVKRDKFGFSGHFKENTWRKWPEILHVNVPWPPQNWLDHEHGLLNFFLLTSLWCKEMSKLWGFWAFNEKRKKIMARNFACWCILTTLKSD